MNDWALIQEHLASGSEQAFAELTKRHGPMVYSTALRRTRDAHLAEDITQAVFLVLARKAPRLSSGTIVAGWLYRTASLLSLRALRDNARRANRERNAMESWNDQSKAALWARLEPELDPALAELCAADRDALVLRYLEQRSHREVGEALGLSEEAAKKRVQRALEKLRVILGRRAAPVTAAALAGLLTSRAALPFPEELAKACAKGLASATAKELATAALGTPWLAAAKIAAALAALALISWLGSSLFDRAEPVETSTPSNNSAPVAAQIDDPPANVAAHVPPAVETRAFIVRVLAAESGLPLPNAEAIKLRYGSKFSREETRTDSAGEIKMEIPDPFESGLGLIAAAPGRSPKFVRWSGHERESLPSTYTVRLGPGTRVVGQVLNEEGSPVAGAKLHFNGHGMEASSREYVTYSSKTSTPETDSQGFWEANFLTPDSKWLGGRITHPDYAESNFSTNLTESPNGSLVFTLQRGGTIAGQVLGNEGTPIPNAEIEFADLTGWRRQRETNADPSGHFTFAKVASGEFRLRASAPEYQPRDLIVKFDGAGQTNVQIALPAQSRLGHSQLLGRVLRANGTPAYGAHLWLVPQQPGAPQWNASVDSNGRFEWHHAPEGLLKLFAGYDGSQRTMFELRADGTEHELRLPESSTLRLSGTVRDAITGAAVPLAKLMLKPSASGGPHMMDEWLGEAYQGSFAFRVETKKVYSAERNFAFPPQMMERMGLKEHAMVLIQAEGYRPKSVDLPAQTNDIEIAIELEPGGPISGMVRFANGDPAPGAQLGFGTKTIRPFMREPGKFAESETPGQEIFTTGHNGQFEIAPTLGAERLLVTHEHGWASIPLPRESNVDVHLQPWARVEGRVMLGGKPTPAAHVKISTATIEPHHMNFDFGTAADPTGRFTFEKVPGGSIQAMILNQGNKMGVFSHPEIAETRAGETTSLTIGGGNGVRLSGRVNVEAPSRVDWGRSPIHLSLKDQTSNFTVAPQSYGFFCRPDGTFALDDVLPGEYRLSLRLEGINETVDRLGNKDRENLGYFRCELTITNQDLDLGILEIVTPNSNNQARTVVPLFYK